MPRKSQSDFGAASYKNRFKASNLKTLYEEHGLDGVLYCAAYLKPTAIDQNLLQTLLCENFEQLINPADEFRKTAFFKCVCLYDFLAYGPKS